MADLVTLCLGAVLSLLGAIGYVLFWEEYGLRRVGRHFGLALIAGIVYTILREQYGYPDLVVTIVVGWFAPDFIESIVQRFKPRKPSEGESGLATAGSFIAVVGAFKGTETQKEFLPVVIIVSGVILLLFACLSHYLSKLKRVVDEWRRDEIKTDVFGGR